MIKVTNHFCSNAIFCFFISCTTVDMLSSIYTIIEVYLSFKYSFLIHIFCFLKFVSISLRITPLIYSLNWLSFISLISAFNYKFSSCVISLRVTFVSEMLLLTIVCSLLCSFEIPSDNISYHFLISIWHSSSWNGSIIIVTYAYHYNY